MVVEGSDEVESKREATPTMAVGFFKQPEDLEFANDMFSKDTHFCQSTVMGFLLLAERFSSPALIGRAALRVKFSNSLEAAI